MHLLLGGEHPTVNKHNSFCTGRVKPCIGRQANRLHQSITLAHEKLLVSFQQGNAAGVAAIYAADAQIMPVHNAAISGRAAIRAFWQGCIDMGIRAMKRTTCEEFCSVETISEVGEYRIFDSSCRLVDVGKYVAIWKVEDKQWKICRDMWTSDLPPN